MNVRIKNMIKYSIPAWKNRCLYYLACRGILNTPPIETKKDGILNISIVSHRDIYMYLVAAKTFYHFFQKGSFVVMNDGSLKQKHIHLIKEHLRGVEIVHIGDIENNAFPIRGTWERLVYAAEHSQDNFIIIFDADTLTQGGLDDLNECVEKNRSFIMQGGSSHFIRPMKEVWEEEAVKLQGQDLENGEVQQLVDANLNKIKGFESLLYIKGTSGFHGHGRGLLTRERLESFSSEMRDVFGRHWNKWGTEQIMACLLVANTKGSISLPYLKYPIYYADNAVDYDKSALIHFMGKCRFQKNYYIDRSRKMIKKLQS